MDQNNIPDFDFELELAKEQITVRGNDKDSMDEHMQMLQRYPNRLRISTIKIEDRTVPNSGGKQVTEVNFNLVANPHPKCDFEYICVYVNLSSWPEAKILDMFPKEIRGGEPIKYATKYGGGITLKVDKVDVGPLFSTEKSTESNVYFIKLRGTGINDSLADWIFEKEPNTRLYFNNLLTLLVEHATMQQLPLPVFSVEANIRLEGWKGYVPVYGSKKILLA